MGTEKGMSAIDEIERIARDKWGWRWTLEKIRVAPGNWLELQWYRLRAWWRKRKVSE
jgi:hypothetical protein